jgi:hypothetical protein
MLKTAVLAPMPMRSVAMATAEPVQQNESATIRRHIGGLTFAECVYRNHQHIPKREHECIPQSRS